MLPCSLFPFLVPRHKERDRAEDSEQERQGQENIVPVADVIDVVGGCKADSAILQVEDRVIVEHEGIAEDPERGRL